MFRLKCRFQSLLEIKFNSLIGVKMQKILKFNMRSVYPAWKPFLLALLLLNITVLQAFTQPDESCESTESQMLVQTTVEWQSPTCGFTTQDPFTPLCRYNNATYFVWIDTAYRPWLTQIKNGSAVVAPLDASDYQVQPDGHHRFSIGIDTDGYVHVTGDMHNYTYQTTGVINPYPVRYQKQRILYWKSNKPESIVDGFTFAGGLNAPTAIPGSGWTYNLFFTDNYGVLYFTGLMHAIEGGNLPGEMGIGLYKYSTATKTWTALGGLADNVRTGTYNKVIFWENSGFAPDKWFQGYQPCFRFDSTNRLHFATTVNTDVALAGNNRVIYAVSDDGGTKWKKANGVGIPNLPIRASDGQPNQGDVVVNSPVGSYFYDNIGVIADKNGTPGVSVNNPAGNNDWYIWDGGAWTLNNAQNFPVMPHAKYGYLDANNNLILIMSGWLSKIFRAETFSSKTYGYDVPYDAFNSVNQDALRSSNMIYAIGVNGKNNTQSILKTTITPAPLPCGWKNQDIAANPPSYSSDACYSNDSFILTNYGSVIDNTSDGFQYTYKKFSGNGSITARVTTSLASVDGYSRAGLMIREDLSANAREISVILAPGAKNKGAIFGVRSQKAGWNNNISTSLNQNPYWLRLVRVGNVFTGFISPDGVSWTQIGTTTLSLPETIYIGLAAASYANGYYMQTATFDHVSAPWGSK